MPTTQTGRTWRLLAVALAAAATATACAAGDTGASGGAKPPTDGTLTVGLLGDIGQPPDPDIYYANNGTAIMMNVYEGLVQYANNTSEVKIAPRLATSWDVSPDKTVYTFHLRQGVTFHDGTPFTSAAIEPSFKRRLDVKGGAAYMVEGVKSVRTPDPYTAIITLDQPNSAFLSYLASPFGPKMESPTALAKNAGSDHAQKYLETHDVGTGPYELASAVSGTKYVLSQYKGYWGPKSPFTTVNLPVYSDAAPLQLALDNGDVSAVVAALPSSSLSRYENNPNVKNYFLPTLQSALLTLNPAKPFFSTVQARMAFLKSVDQQKLVSQVLGKRSEVATTLYAKGMIPGGADKQNIGYDPAVMAAYAKTLPPGTPMTIGYANGNPNAQNIAQILAAQLQAIGVQATAQGYDTSIVFSWPQKPTAGPDAFVDGNNGPDGGDPYLWGHVFWDKSGGIDYFACDVPQVDEKLNEALKTGDTALYVQAAQQYSANGCYLNLSYNRDWVVAQKWLTGVPESQNLGANELNFSLLGIAR
ncbi:ABC transporter substrate-binding protein [Amycolatopsis sp. NPDC049253]|uniref:ABC transporter substrate-binding protein n=1 Tax=Amycolatopsis sp. NPDC049253 TaxID=3155274 RepID=UPI00342E898E